MDDHHVGHLPRRGWQGVEEALESFDAACGRADANNWAGWRRLAAVYGFVWVVNG
jgi:hypothetical protein